MTPITAYRSHDGKIHERESFALRSDLMTDLDDFVFATPGLDRDFRQHIRDFFLTVFITGPYDRNSRQHQKPLNAFKFFRKLRKLQRRYQEIERLFQDEESRRSSTEDVPF